jgi:hypothetical protein
MTCPPAPCSANCWASATPAKTPWSAPPPVPAVASIARRAARAPACLIGAQRGGHDEASQGDGQVGRTKRGHELGELVAERQQGREDILERTEASLDGGFTRGVALLLRGVLGLQLVEGELGGRRHLRRPLVGEGLDAWAVAQHDSHRIDDVVGALARVDDDRVEQAGISTADVLHADELRRAATAATG